VEHLIVGTNVVGAAQDLVVQSQFGIVADPATPRGWHRLLSPHLPSSSRFSRFLPHPLSPSPSRERGDRDPVIARLPSRAQRRKGAWRSHPLSPGRTLTHHSL